MDATATPIGERADSFHRTRSNPDGSISLLARRVEFVHPVSKQPICVEAPVPELPEWKTFGN